MILFIMSYFPCLSEVLVLVMVQTVDVIVTVVVAAFVVDVYAAVWQLPRCLASASWMALFAVTTNSWSIFWFVPFVGSVGAATYNTTICECPKSRQW